MSGREVWACAVGMLALWAFPLACFALAAIDELVMPRVRRRVRAWRRRRRIGGAPW